MKLFYLIILHVKLNDNLKFKMGVIYFEISLLIVHDFLKIVHFDIITLNCIE